MTLIRGTVVRLSVGNWSGTRSFDRCTKFSPPSTDRYRPSPLMATRSRSLRGQCTAVMLRFPQDPLVLNASWYWVKVSPLSRVMNRPFCSVPTTNVSQLVGEKQVAEMDLAPTEPSGKSSIAILRHSSSIDSRFHSPLARRSEICVSMHPGDVGDSEKPIMST